jgi:mRNA-degrading endonuclease RelE of RelBE toxin-antitoxin system
MDKIIKFLRKLPKKELRKVREVIDKLEKGDLAGLDIQKLSSHKNIFRVRTGDIRIIFFKERETFDLISIERRTEQTYKF